MNALFNDVVTVVAAVLAIAALGFLLVALIKPEKF